MAADGIDQFLAAFFKKVLVRDFDSGRLFCIQDNEFYAL